MQLHPSLGSASVSVAFPQVPTFLLFLLLVVFLVALGCLGVFLVFALVSVVRVRLCVCSGAGVRGSSFGAVAVLVGAHFGLFAVLRESVGHAVALLWCLRQEYL